MSVLDELFTQIEQGEPVDPVRLARLQSLELLRIGEQLLADQMEANRQADERAAELLRSLN